MKGDPPAAPGACASGPPLSVVLIEDNEQNSYLVSFLMRARGHVVTCAADGPRGIELARRSQPDVILLDIQLPGLDGYAVARALRQEAHLRATPLVAVTSYAMAGDRDKSFAAGCNGYIEKPIDPETFAVQVESLVADCRAGRAA